MTEVETLSIPTRTHGRALVRCAPAAPRGVLVGFHGYAEHAGEQMARLIDIPGSEDWTLVAVQGLNRFYRRRTEETVASWMTREDRPTAIDDNIRYVETVVDSVVAGNADPLVFAGFSQGVAMAFRAAVRGRHGAAGVIAVGGDVPPELLEDAATTFPGVLLVRGRADEWYTDGKMERDRVALAARGVRVHAEVLACGHEWTADVSALAARFLAEIGARRPV